MKKFRVEVDGEEFIVNLEEIKTESAVEPVSAKTTQKTSSSKKSSQTKQSVKKAAPKVKKAPQKDVSTQTTAAGDVVAPMPGSILEINVEQGQSVEKGDLLIVLEAMKMENEITALQSGTIKEIKVNVGDSVDAEDVLLVTG